MKKSELSVVIFMLGFCAFFFYETLQLPPAAQSYPKFVIGLLAVLTLMQLVKMATAILRSSTTFRKSGPISCPGSSSPSWRLPFFSLC